MGPSTRAPDFAWRFTAAYRLGQHWQQAGDYARAQVAYSEALELAPKHRASRLNLAVTQIRLRAYHAALSNLEVLCGVEDLPLDPRDQAHIEPHALVVAYNRALVLRYLGRLEEAKIWSQRVAIAAYKRSDDELVSKLAPTALMLHAGILLDVHKDDDRLLSRAAQSALATPGPVDSRRLHRDPATIEWYVRQHLGADQRPEARGHYNIACYLARLAELVPSRADELSDRALGEARLAVTDARLVPWAARDPALDPLHRRPEWATLVEGQPPAPVASDPAATPAPLRIEGDAQASRSTVRERAVSDAVELLGELHVDATERRARRTSDPFQRFEELKGQTAAIDERTFHLHLTRAVADLRDPVTAYLLPPPIRDRAAVLPLRLTERFEAGGTRRVVVGTSEPWIADTGLRPGAHVTHWNGVPIEQAIERRTAFVAAADIDGRRARALATLTCRATAVFAPLDADEVVIGFDADREMRVEWEYRQAPPVAAPDGLQSVDPLVAATARLSAPEPAFAISNFDGPRGIRFTRLRISTFEVADTAAFVRAVAAALEAAAPSGLVLDLRGNGGGSIAAAERLLQLFGPGPIAPQPIELRATRLTATLAHEVASFHRWSRSIDRAIVRGRRFSDGLPVTSDHEAACNAIGRKYSGPVVVILDPLSAGATDIFAAGFADHGLGPVLATAARGGMPGGVAWRTEGTKTALPRVLRRLPGDAAFQLSTGRTLRPAGPLAEHPVRPDRICRPNASGAPGGDADILHQAAELLMAPA